MYKHGRTAVKVFAVFNDRLYPCE